MTVQQMVKGFLISVAAVAGWVPAPATAAAAGFALKDEPGKYLDVTFDGRVVARYMYDHDTTNAEKRLETYKPYLHIFDAEGKAPITKGPGGLYTHHRGVFIGWNRIGFDGKTYDRWHMKGGEQVHQEFLKQEADADSATLISKVHWNDSEGQPLLIEERTMTLRKPSVGGYLQLDFESKLTASAGDLKLNGDPEHAGVQFRPANEVVKAETVYFFPKEGADPHKDRDYPWVGETFTLNDHHYSVVHLNHPDNPKQTLYSAYRDYGRFGAFFTHDLKKDESLTVKYRILVAEGDMLPAAAIQKCWDEFAGVTTPSPVPPLYRAGGQAKAGAKKTK